MTKTTRYISCDRYDSSHKLTLDGLGLVDLVDDHHEAEQMQEVGQYLKDVHIYKIKRVFKILII